MNPFWMVVADLRKTLITTLGILLLLAMGVSVSIAVSLFDRAFRQAGAASAQDFDLVVGAAGSRLDLVLASVYLRTDEVLPLLDSDAVRRLEQDARVAQSSPLVFADQWQGHPFVGVGPKFPALRPGLTLAEGRWPQQPFEVTVGSQTGLALEQSVHGSHGAHESESEDESEDHDAHDEHEYRVVGVLQRSGTPWDRALITPVESLWEIHHETEAGKGVSAVLVKPRDFASAYSLRADYRSGLTTAAFPGEVLSGLFGIVDAVKEALSLISLLFQALVFAAVLLSLMAALPSQARWVGLLRALGASAGYVFLTLWMQSAVIFLVAGLLGAGVGWVAVQVLASVVADQTGLTLTIRWSLVETGLVLGISVVGLLGALLPALAGYRTSVRRSLLGQ